MPIQKDLKKIVRTRMEKTGEAYTTARLHVVSKKREPEPPPPNYAEIAGMSDAALVKNTGRNWAEWVSILDAVAAHEKTPRRDRKIRLLPRLSRLVESERDRRLRAHSRSARERPAPRRLV